MHHALVAALLDCIAFLELSGEGAVDPDAAVGQLESIAFTLQDLPPTARRELIAIIEAIAASEDNARRRALFVAMPRAMGLCTD